MSSVILDQDQPVVAFRELSRVGFLGRMIVGLADGELESAARSLSLCSGVVVVRGCFVCLSVSMRYGDFP